MEQYGGSLSDNTLKSVLKIESRLCNSSLSIDTLMKKKTFKSGEFNFRVSFALLHLDIECHFLIQQLVMRKWDKSKWYNMELYN